MHKALPGLALAVVTALGQPSDPAYASLNRAYEALRAKNYDAAIENFDQAAVAAPERASIRKDLAYTLLKVGQTEFARDQFAEAMRLDSSDDQVALEYGFLCYETKQPVAARRVFDRLRKAGNAIAIEAFENVDKPLREGIARWKQALELSPDNFSAHEELAYLHLEMGNRQAAEQQFRLLPESVKTAQLVPRNSESPVNSKILGEQSLEKGYLNDALKYLHAAHEDDPMDFEVMLKLGWAYNQVGDDREAVRWFNQARQSSDAGTALAASRAYGNLTPSLRRFRTTVWAFPMISTRWRDTFVYAQAKTELRWGFPIHPYLSLRFIGDARGQVRMGASVSPQNLSERSVIVGAGLASPVFRGLAAWFEAGEALRYQITRGETGRGVPDYRGGISYTDGLRGPHRLFVETNDDGVFISRFGNDSLLYSQNRTGRALGESVRAYWNWNATFDAKGEYWANTVEIGPGVRFRVNALQFTVNFLRGVYLVNQSNPYRPNFNDLRIGIWYAFTR